MQDQDFQVTDSASLNSSRPKTQQRIRYEAQLEVLRRKNGELEAIRNKLGFSQKQMCELLLVDPSAWSRWIKPGEDAPAHIYQALDWYLSRGLDVEMNSRSMIAKAQLPKMQFIEKTQSSEVADENVAALSEVTEKITAWENEKNQLLEKLDKSEKLQAGWKLFLILNSIILIYLILTRYFSI